MTWILVSIISYFFGAVAALLDKVLLSGRIGHPSVYSLDVYKRQLGGYSGSVFRSDSRVRYRRTFFLYSSSAEKSSHDHAGSFRTFSYYRSHSVFLPLST